MPKNCLLYYITDRTAFPGDESARRRYLLDKIAEAAAAGVNYIQLREKDLPTRDLELLAREAICLINKLRAGNHELRTVLLINSRTDVALATNAAGVHLPANDISPAEVRSIWKRAMERCGAGTPAREPSPPPQISISCHSPAEVTQAAANSATLALFAPVFEKKDAPGATPTGLDSLRQACHAKIPVLALGGITLQNAESCLHAGAAGIAAIRLFQENDIATVVRQLRDR
ncbi:MAG: thiamine phosphate synthase [Candidatus Sulfotelmatobacter sp.]